MHWQISCSLKGGKMKKRYSILAALVVSVTLAGLYCHTAYADNLTLISKGRFEYDNKTDDIADDIIFDVEDLKLLDQKIETLSLRVESTKAEIINILKMRNNPNISISDTADYADIIHYLKAIDTIPEDTFFYECGTEGNDNTIKRYRKEKGAYYACDSHGFVAEGTLATDVSGLNLVPYTSMAGGNINAGFAGYVFGNFYLGSEADNAVSYSQGVEDGKKNIIDNLEIKYTYHRHSGKPSAVGGCYGEISKEGSIRCSSTYKLETWIDPESGRQCVAATCDYNHTIKSGSDQTLIQPYIGLPCESYITGIVKYIDLKCGKKEDTIESASIIY